MIDADTPRLRSHDLADRRAAYIVTPDGNAQSFPVQRDWERRDPYFEPSPLPEWADIASRVSGVVIMTLAAIYIIAQVVRAIIAGVPHAS